MKNSLHAVIAILAATRLAQASQAACREGSGLLTVLFLSFCVVIAAFQVLPAATLFSAMVREFFAVARRAKANPLGEGAGGR